MNIRLLFFLFSQPTPCNGFTFSTQAALFLACNQINLKLIMHMEMMVQKWEHLKNEWIKCMTILFPFFEDVFVSNFEHHNAICVRNRICPKYHFFQRTASFFHILCESSLSQNMLHNEYSFFCRIGVQQIMRACLCDYVHILLHWMHPKIFSNVLLMNFYIEYNI